MRPLGIIGVLLIVFGIVVLALRGISYTKDRDAVRVGPVEVAAEKKGFVPPAVGLVALVAGVVILVAARRQV
jgi:uncharacterized membrane protein HdeD (DUF308 family)